MPTKYFYGLRLVLLGFLCTVCIAACGDIISAPGASLNPVIISSKPFTENILLAEIYAQALENAGIPVQRKFSLGSTDVLHPAIQKGEISLYPDYTGTLYSAVLHLPRENPFVARIIYDKIAKVYPAQFKLVLLDAAPMNNTFSLAVSREIAERYNLRTMSDLAPKANLFRFVTSSDWTGERSETDGLRAFQAAYGGYLFKSIEVVPGGERYKAFLGGAADVILAYTTDGEIAGHNLILLEDDKNFFAPYQVVPIIREDTLATYPNIKSILNTVSLRLTSAKATTMNWKIDGPEKLDYVRVARNFLKAEGLTK